MSVALPANRYYDDRQSSCFTSSGFSFQRDGGLYQVMEVEILGFSQRFHDGWKKRMTFQPVAL